MQWIIGIVSDRFDRTIILIIVPCLVALFSVVIMTNKETSYHRLLIEMAFFGGLIFAVYPVAVARANDVFEGKDAVGVSSALLLCYSIGAVFGPILSSIIMTLMNTPYGLYVYWSLVSGIFAVITIYFKHKERITIIEPADQVDFMPMQKTSSVASTMDPRTDAQEAIN